MTPVLREVEKRLVLDAVVEKKLVVVALVVVELPVIKRLESMVEEAVERKPLVKPTVVEVETPQAVGVNGKVEPVPVASAAQPNLPAPSYVKTFPDWQTVNPPP